MSEQNSYDKNDVIEAVSDTGREGGLCMTVGRGEDGMTVRGVLRQAQGVSQRLIRKIKHGAGEAAGALYINGQPARFRDKVKAGDEVRLVFPCETSHMAPQDIRLSILYEDDDILVLDKAPGMVVHPTKGHRDGTVANAIVFHMRERGENYKPRFVSRLDMGTSGVLLVGKNSHAQDSLAKQGGAGGVEKTYIALLAGRLEDDLPPVGVIDLPIGLIRAGEPHRTVLPESKGGYASQTAYEVIGALGANEEGGKAGLLRYARSDEEGPEMRGAARADDNAFTIVRAQLLTGRTHQIRVHFAHYGHPVLGDNLYGEPSPFIARQALHAAGIAFAHPATGKAMRFEAPLPSDIASVISGKERI